MENNKNKKSVKFQGDMLNFCEFIQVFVFTRNHHLNARLFGYKKHLELKLGVKASIFGLNLELETNNNIS